MTQICQFNEYLNIFYRFQHFNSFIYLAFYIDLRHLTIMDLSYFQHYSNNGYNFYRDN